MVTHAYMGPVPAFFYAAGQLMDYGVHSWDIREGSGRNHALSGDAADLLVPFMFAIWQGTVRADAVGDPFTIGIRVGGRNAGDYRVTIADGPHLRAGRDREPAGLHRVRRGQHGAVRLRAVQHRHGPRRHGAGRAVPQLVLPDLVEAPSAGSPQRRARTFPRRRRVHESRSNRSSHAQSGGRIVIGPRFLHALLVTVALGGATTTLPSMWRRGRNRVAG